MKVLLTGEPHSGKTTLLKKIIKNFDNKRGFYTDEILVGGNRVGFEIVTSDGDKSTIAHIDFQTEDIVGKYKVDIKNLDKLLPSLLSYSDKQLLYIDEIARMELFSEKFKDLVNSYLDSPNNFIGTIANNFESDFRDSILNRGDVKLVTVTLPDRDRIEKELTHSLQSNA